MFAQLKLQYAGMLTSGAYLLLLVIGVKLDSVAGWLGVLGVTAAIGFFAWMSAYRRERLITDTPTSKVASAAQGYVELFGRAEQHDGRMLLSKLSSHPCTWYRYRIEEREGDKWKEIDSGWSQDTFLLADETAKCVIDPDYAEIITDRKRTWTRDDYRYTEWLIVPKDPLYAIGEFSTIGGSQLESDYRADLDALLTEWKKNQPQLLARFDLNRDGKIDLQEWEMARREARREVEKRQARMRLEDQSINIMRKPRDGRLFLISNLAPEAVARKYTLWTAFHLLVFFIAGGTSVYLAL